MAGRSWSSATEPGHSVPWTESVPTRTSRSSTGVSTARSLTCANHLWSFDATTGKGIRPPTCRLDQYALKVQDGDIFVDTDASPSRADS